MDDIQIKNFMQSVVTLSDHIDQQIPFNYYDFIQEVENMRKRYGVSPEEQNELEVLEGLLRYGEVTDDL